MLTRGNIEFFRQQVLTSDSAFPLFDESDTYLSDWVFQSKMGDVKLIYAGMPDSRKLSAPKETELMAIVMPDGLIYLTGERCILLHFNKLPDGFLYIKDRMNELNDKAKQALTHYYNSLQPAEDYKPNNHSNWVEARHRKLIHPKQDVLDDAVFDIADAIASLIHHCPIAGRSDLEFDFDGKVKDFCEKNARAWSLQKARLADIEAISSQPDFILPWEQRMADAIRSLGNSKSIVIGIRVKDQVLNEKIDPKRLLSILSLRDDLNEWDFSNRKRGQALIRAFRSLSESESSSMYCSDISTLTFRGNIIYDSAEVEKD